MYIKLKKHSGVIKLLSKISTFAILLLSFFLFNACSHSVSSKKTKLLVQNIKVGETGQKHVKDMFGSPTYFGGRDEKTWWMYVFVNKQGYKTLSLYFDEDGRVHDFYYTPTL